MNKTKTWLPRMAWAVALAAGVFTFAACEPEPAAGAPDAGMLNKIPSLDDPPERLTALLQRTCVLGDDGTPTCWGWNSARGMREISEGPEARFIRCTHAYCYRISTDGTLSSASFRSDGTADLDSSWMTPDDAGRFTRLVFDEFACGVNTEGGLKCFTPPGYTLPLPELDAPVSAVELGHDFGCVLHLDGRVECWGELPAERPQPAIFDAIQLAAGRAHVCALLASGTVVCWGESSLGAADVPADLTNVVSISSVGLSTCALLDTGHVRCWGDNRDGQADVPAGLRASAIAVGGAHACALTDSGVTCWGDGSYGARWGPGATFDDVLSGTRLLCGRSGAAVSCWYDAWLNLPFEDPVPAPFRVEPDSSLAIRLDGGCEARNSGDVRCWGRYEGSAVESAADVETITLGTEACVLNRAQRVLCGRGGELAEVATDVERLEAFRWGTCAVRLDGHALCWGWGQEFRVPSVVAPVDFARFDGAMCVTDAAGEVSCIDEQGQPRANPLGDGVFRRIASGARVMCGQRRDGTLVCIGENTHGVLNPPAQLPKIRRLLMLEDTACAHLESGEVKCWGEVHR